MSWATKVIDRERRHGRRKKEIEERERREQVRG